MTNWSHHLLKGNQALTDGHIMHRKHSPIKDISRGVCTGMQGSMYRYAGVYVQICMCVYIGICVCVCACTGILVCKYR